MPIMQRQGHRAAGFLCNCLNIRRRNIFAAFYRLLPPGPDRGVHKAGRRQGAYESSVRRIRIYCLDEVRVVFEPLLQHVDALISRLGCELFVESSGLTHFALPFETKLLKILVQSNSDAERHMIGNMSESLRKQRELILEESSEQSLDRHTSLLEIAIISLYNRLANRLSSGSEVFRAGGAIAAIGSFG